MSEGRSNASGEVSLLLFDEFKFRPTEDAYVTPSFASSLSVVMFFEVVRTALEFLCCFSFLVIVYLFIHCFNMFIAVSTGFDIEDF